MDFNKELIDKIINVIVIPRRFGADCDEEYCEIANSIQEILDKREIEAEVAFGCTKLVIIPKNSNCVIKIPFNGELSWNYDEDEYDFEPFHYANEDLQLEDGEDWDYCENEVAKYENAVKAGFGDFFLDTRLYCYKSGSMTYPIYTQKKATAGAFSHEAKYSKATLTYVEDSRKQDKFRWLGDYTDWICAAIEKYGIKKVSSFVEYLHENRMDADLHSANIGWDNDRPVILDWAGFRD